ncbi:unnamed protein product [Effrenium voratum]|nr:unnamed protein product [Effrenium voratum]
MEPTPPMLPRPGNRRPLRMWRGLTQASIAEGMSKDHEESASPTRAPSLQSLVDERRRESRGSRLVHALQWAKEKDEVSLADGQVHLGPS